MTMRLYLAGLTSKEVNFEHTKIFKITASVQSHLDFFFSVAHIVSYSCGVNDTQSPMMYAWHGLDTAATFLQFNSRVKAVSSWAKKGQKKKKAVLSQESEPAI